MRWPPWHGPPACLGVDAERVSAGCGARAQRVAQSCWNGINSLDKEVLCRERLIPGKSVLSLRSLAFSPGSTLPESPPGGLREGGIYPDGAEAEESLALHPGHLSGLPDLCFLAGQGRVWLDKLGDVEIQVPAGP